MKKLASVLLSSALVVSMAAISASAEVTELPADWDPTAYEYIVVGNEGILGSYAWQPTNEAFKMNYDEAAGVWYLNLDGVANEGETFEYLNSPQYKVVVFGYDDDPWSFSFNESGVAYGLDSNSPVDFGDTAETAEVVTITFDGQKTQSTIDNPYEPTVTDDPTEHTYYAVGNENLFNPAWDPACPDYQLTKGADGIYSVTIPVTEDQWDVDVAYKVAQDGTWDVSYNDQGLAEGLNSDATLYIAEGTVAVVITFNPETLCAGAECVMAGEDPTDAPTEAPTDEATEAPTADATEAPTAEATEAPTAEGTEAPTDEATVAPTQAPSNATNPTSSSTQAPTQAATKAPATSSSATGKVATGDSTSVALLIGMLMLAGAGVVVARKRIAE